MGLWFRSQQSGGLLLQISNDRNARQALARSACGFGDKMAGFLLKYSLSV